jgi:hypothetical protein
VRREDAELPAAEVFQQAARASENAKVASPFSHLKGEEAMFYWLLERVLRRGLRSRRGILRLGELANLAQAGTSVWALTQERARLQYLAAKEEYDKHGTWQAFQQALEQLIQLHSTNSVIQSLLQEHLLEQLVARQAAESPAARRCA